MTVGAGPEGEEAKRVIGSNPQRARITLAGAQPLAEVPGIMAGHDFFLAHSRTGGTTGQMEAFGVAYIEALAQGMPIVGTACGSPLEIVDHGETGLVSAPLDTGEQARNLVRLGDPDLCRSWERTRAKLRRDAIIRIRKEGFLKKLYYRRVYEHLWLPLLSCCPSLQFGGENGITVLIPSKLKNE